MFVSGSDGVDTTSVDVTKFPTTSYPTTTTTAYPADSFTVDRHDISMKVGQSYTLGILNYPMDAGIPLSAIHWKSSNEAVATIAEDGTISALGGGTATITGTILGNTESENLVQEIIVRVKRN